MKKTTVLFLALLVLTVIVSGCVGNKPTTTTAPPAGDTPTTPPATGDTGGSESIPSVDSGTGLTVETPQSTSDENVDLGSLI